MDQLWVSLATIASSVLGAWYTASKVAGGSVVARALMRALEDRAVTKHPVVLVSADPAMAGKVRTTLVQRGFADVTIQGADYRGRGAAVVVFVPGLDPVDFANRAGLSEGLLYTTEHIDQRGKPAGDWTFANSPIALFARLTELIQWQRSVSSQQ